MPKNQGSAGDSAKPAKKAKGAPHLSRGAKPTLKAIAPNTSQLSQAGVMSLGSIGQSLPSASLLPASAPASSLLPAIPAFQQFQKAQLNPNQLQAQLALLLHSGALGQAAATGISNQLTVGSGFPSLATAQQPANPLMPAMAPLLANQVTSYAAPRNMAREILPHQMQGLSYDQLSKNDAKAMSLRLQCRCLTGLCVFPVKHVAMLQQLKQPIPQALAIAVAEARRKEEKKNAKRVANRKSASSSRARKKALVQEMTELNMRLKRQALILALLPDLVIAVDVEGVITFCSEQAERLLQHSPDSLIGAKLTDLLIPSSHGRFLNLVKKLVDGSKDAATDAAVTNDKGGKQGHQVSVDSTLKVGENESSSARANVSAESSSVAAVSSNPSFPMAVVKVAAASKGASDENDNSDTSASRDSKQPSSLTASGSVPRSPSASLGNSGSDDSQKQAAVTGTSKKKKKDKLPSSDTSNTSSLSVDAESNKLQSANANLERNVRLHNKKMKGGPLGADFTDDVIGETVTANNASARLSSLRVPKGQEGSSSEEDSGYRESNDSREETSSSSASDTSETKGKCRAGR